MAGVVGSTDISGTNTALSGTTDQLLNPVGTQTFATGDVVTQIDYYVATAFSGTNRVYEVGLYALNAGAANGATKVWGKQITVANGASGWVSVPVSSEAITASNGATLAVAIGSAVSGSGNVTFKQGATSTSKSHAAAGASLGSTWTETTTSTRQIALTVTTTTPSGSGPTLTSGTPTGTTGSSPTVGFTTDSTTGTARIVLDSAANLSGVTATQILAGQKANGTAAAYDSGDITVTDTSPDYAFSGIASGTYTVAAAHDDGDESNVLTWTLVIDATAPSFSAGPTISSEAATSATVNGTSNENATAYVVVTASGASQPSDGTFDASSFTDVVSADVAFSIPVTGLTALSLLRGWIQLVDAYGNRTTDSEYILTSPSGYSRVTIGTPNTTAANRITATGDLASGDVVAWGNIQGTGSVIVYDDGSFEADAGVTAFTVYVGNHTDGWGSSAVQDIEGLDEIAPSVWAAVINTSGSSMLLAFDEAVDFGPGGNGGVTLSMSGGAVIATYSSGAGTSLITYNLSRALTSSETGTVTYVQPGDGIQDISGNDLASFGPTVVTNNSTNDGIAPQFTNGIVASNGNSITFQASKAVQFGAGGNTGFTVSLTGGACTLTYSSGSGSANLVYTTSRTIQEGESGTAAYTQPGNGVEDAFGLDAATFTDLPITNNSTADTIVPEIVSVVLVSSTSLRITANEAVTFGAGGNAGWAITLSGGAATLTYASGDGTNVLLYTVSRAVAADETGTYAYTQPGDGVEDLAGNDLATIASGSIINSSGSLVSPARLHIWTGIGI